MATHTRRIAVTCSLLVSSFVLSTQFFQSRSAAGPSPTRPVVRQDHYAHRVPTIDGAITPDRVPDRVAYYHFFHTLMDDRDARRQAAYARSVFVTTEPRANQASNVVASGDALVTFAKRHAPTLHGMELEMLTSRATLSQTTLMARRVALIDELTTALAQEMSAAHFATIRRFVLVRVKQRTRLFGGSGAALQ